LLLATATAAGCSDGAPNRAESQDAGPDADADGDTDTGPGTEIDAGDDCTAGWHVAFAARAGGPVSDDALPEAVAGIAALDDGSAIATGEYRGDAVFGEGQPTETTLAAFDAAGGEPDGFAARYARDGSLLWAKRFGGASWDLGVEVAATDGGALVLASYGETATFGPGEAGATTVSDAAYGASYFDSAIAVLAPDSGTCERAFPAVDAMDYAGVGAFVPMPDGGSIIAGEFWTEIRVGSASGDPLVLASSGSSDFDVFIARLDGAGGGVWARKPDGVWNERHPRLARLSGGAILATGSYSHLTTFGTGEAGETQLGCDAGSCLFLAAYDVDGALLWARDLAAGCAFSEPSIAATADGGFAMTTELTGACALEPGEPNEVDLGPTADGTVTAMVARFGDDGELLWAREIAGISAVPPPDATPLLPLTALGGGEIAIAGVYLGGHIVVGGGEGDEISLPETDDRDFFVALFSPDGELEWAAAQGGPQDHDVPMSLAADGADAFYVGGAFGGHARFGTCAGEEIYLDSSGTIDAFLLRFERDAR
jgi:hypothetical protein